MTRITIGGLVTALSAVCVVGMTCLGHCLLRAPQAAASIEPGAATRPTGASFEACDEDRALRSSCRSAAPLAPSPATRLVDDDVDPARSLRVSEQRALFLARLEHEEGGLEAAARRMLAGNGPDSEKVDVLRALLDARSPQACDILAEAVERLPDASDARGESVPRCALRLLSAHAAGDARARASLARIAWNATTPVPAALRASAAASLAVAASGTEAREVAARLQVERDALVRAAGVEALSRNTDPAAAAAFRSLGIDIAARAQDDDDR